LICIHGSIMSDDRNSFSQSNDQGSGNTPSAARRPLSLRENHIANLERLISSNANLIEAMEAERITGMGYGAGPSDPRSVSEEIRRLRKQNEEHRSLVRLEKAIDHRNEAHAALSRQRLPHGNGLPTMEDLSEVDRAEQEVRAAQAEIERITAEIRAGLR
jgi:hypothetical protein